MLSLHKISKFLGKGATMPKIPDFSKFDLQSIVNSVKSIINPESTPNVTEGDPIGAKIVEISSLLQGVANTQEKNAKDLHKINSLLNGLYKDLEQFRKLEAEIHQKQQAESNVPPTESTTAKPSVKETETVRNVKSKPGVVETETVKNVRTDSTTSHERATRPSENDTNKHSDNK